MFILLFANEDARRGWLELKRSAPAAWTQAEKVLTERPTTPSVRCFSLATNTLRMKDFRRRRYPQWVYAVSNSMQVYYLVDAERRVVFLRQVVKHEFKGIMV